MRYLTPRMTGSQLLLTALLVVAAVAWTGTAVAFEQLPGADVATLTEQESSTPADMGNDLTISAAIPVGTYQITQTQRGHDLSVENLGYLLIPGKPTLPSRIFALAIPPGAEIVDIAFDTGEPVTLPGTYQISPAPLPRVIGEEDPLVYEEERKRYEENYSSVYGSDDAYPQAVVEFVRTAGYRKYNLVDVRVVPFTYRPISGELTYYPDITVHVDYRFPQNPRRAIVDNLARTEDTAKEIVLNYDHAQSWHGQGRSAPRGLHDFVIITLDSLTSSVTPLVNWETDKGRTVEVVTTSWINSNYTGYYDLAAKIRAFLRDKYPSEEWGIQDVLLIGHYDSVPMRRTAQNIGYGQPETDFYYAELTLPDDESWDANGNHQYGENSDPIDYYSEVNVGRIPWSIASTVLSICEKSVAYEQNEDPAFKKNILLLGGYFWADTDNAVLMEAKVDQTWMSDWTMTRMYEKNANYWSDYDCDYPLVHSNVMSVWPSGQYAFVDWAGHGSPTSCHIYGLGAPAFISSSDCPSLNDDYPAIIFADACSNSDTDSLNIGQAMLKEGAVGFVGATKVALGCPGWSSPYSGSSQSLDYFFTTSVTSGEYTQGGALQWALTEMYVNGLWNYNKYETFEWGALWGNPDLRMGPPPTMSIRFPDGLPEYMEPGTPTPFTVQIMNGTENYIPGTGMLHYRYDGGTFLTSGLTHVIEDLYEAMLPPAGCSATPEYYISAQGDGGATVLNPADAPNVVYTAIVGTFTAIMQENLDSDPGWSTEGLWAFGTPTGGGGQYGEPDPTSGHTGDNVYGYNLSGDYENNLSERDLTSGPIDCTGLSQVTLKFWRWLGVERSMYDHAYIRVSYNGSNWTTIWENSSEITDSSWGLYEYDISSVADGQPTVYLRWTMGTTDTSWQYCGWNIDDVEIWGLLECSPSELVAPLPEDSLGIACTDDTQCDPDNEAKCVEGVCYAPKHRYVSIRANPLQIANTARRITLQGTEPPARWWVGTPHENGGLDVADVVSEPVYIDQWPSVVHVMGCEIATGQTYLIQAIAAGEDIGNETNYTEAFALHTPSVWGDTVSGSGESMSPPDSTASLTDIMAAVALFRGDPVAPIAWLDIAPSGGSYTPDQNIGLADIMGCIAGYQGEMYPGLDPLDCP